VGRGPGRGAGCVRRLRAVPVRGGRGESAAAAGLRGVAVEPGCPPGLPALPPSPGGLAPRGGDVVRGSAKVVPLEPRGRRRAPAGAAEAHVRETRDRFLVALARLLEERPRS